MASRAKKKASNNTQNVGAVPQVQSIDQNNNKWATIHLASTIVVLILLFFMIILSPTIFAKIKLSLTGEEADSAEYSFNASSLDMMFAPIRGCTSGFRFMLEKIGCEIKSDEAYQKLIDVIGPMLPANTVENVDALGVSLTVMSYVFFAIFIAMVVLCILDFKFKKKGLLS